MNSVINIIVINIILREDGALVAAVALDPDLQREVLDVPDDDGVVL